MGEVEGGKEEEECCAGQCGIVIRLKLYISLVYGIYHYFWTTALVIDIVQ